MAGVYRVELYLLGLEANVLRVTPDPRIGSYFVADSGYATFSYFYYTLFLT